MSSQRQEQLVPLEKLRPNRWNCNSMSRQEFEALKDGMTESGPENTPPIIVRSLGDGRFEIIDGEQRYTAAKALGWDGLYTLLRAASDDDVKYSCLALNYARGRMNPFKLFDLLYDEWEGGSGRGSGGGMGGLSMGELEEKFHGLFNQRYIQKVLTIRVISEEVRAFIESYRSSDKGQDDFQVTLGHLNIMAKLQYPSDQMLYCKLMLEMKLSPEELEIQVKRRLDELREWEKTKTPSVEEKGEVKKEKEEESSSSEDDKEEKEEVEFGNSVDEESEESHPPPPLTPRRTAKPRTQKVEEVFTCPTCSGQFAVNYVTKRVQSLRSDEGHIKAVEQEGRPSKTRENCPACGRATADIDYLEREVEWETKGPA